MCGATNVTMASAQLNNVLIPVPEPSIQDEVIESHLVRSTPRLTLGPTPAERTPTHTAQRSVDTTSSCGASRCRVEERFDLDDTKRSTSCYHHSELGEFWLSSDAVIPSFTRSGVRCGASRALPAERTKRS